MRTRSATRVHRMQQGAEIEPDGRVRFRIWAPAQEHLSLELDIGEGQPLPMAKLEGGWHELLTGAARPGTRYRYVLPDGLKVPDPVSRFQPDDVHGRSEVIDPSSWEWSDREWNGRPWEEAVIYEIHIGTFTAEGTFQAAIGKLDHLAALGITAIEIMPVADFPGRRNWGYDGVLLYAPDSSYGRPEDFKALIEAAHARGIMVLLDVVYNHFGPDGNYLWAYAPQFFTERHTTPWGAAVNFDGAEGGAVREFVVHNALYWLEEFHLDGLRLDAVHAILDDSPKHILEEIAERVRAENAGRHVHLLLENEENQASRLVRSPDGEPRWYTGQWNDDVHHVLHTAVTGEDKGYYLEYLNNTAALGRALAEGFAFQGEVMEYRGHPRGEASGHLPPSSFVAFIQNHDQIGNRAFGDRLGAIAPAEALRAAAAVYLLLPQVPMLFMGEEWNCAQPFAFFCDFGAELGEAVRKGRRQEFARFPEFQDEKQRERIPDPQADKTFFSSKLRWEDISKPDHAAWLDWYQRILKVRQSAIVELISDIPEHGGRYELVGREAVVVRWRLGSGGELTLAANLSADTTGGFPPPEGSLLWQEGEPTSDGNFEPWSVRWTVTKPGVG